MLVVTRKDQERIFVTVPMPEGDMVIVVQVIEIRDSHRVRIGIQAPANVKIVREDLAIKMRSAS